jgi:hypothetical protein
MRWLTRSLPILLIMESVRRFRANVFVPAHAKMTVDRLKTVLQGVERAKRPSVIDDRRVSVRTKVSWRSWGERVTCVIEPAEGGHMVWVESLSSVPSTLIDWGVNRHNVEQVIRALGADRS